jgi:hypothetical protein
MSLDLIPFKLQINPATVVMFKLQIKALFFNFHAYTFYIKNSDFSGYNL